MNKTMRKFNDLNEVLLALNTITMEEAEDVNKRLGITFTIKNGRFVNAEYESCAELEHVIGI